MLRKNNSSRSLKIEKSGSKLSVINSIKVLRTELRQREEIVSRLIADGERNKECLTVIKIVINIIQKIASGI